MSKMLKLKTNVFDMQLRTLVLITEFYLKSKLLSNQIWDGCCIITWLERIQWKSRRKRKCLSTGGYLPHT